MHVNRWSWLCVFAVWWIGVPCLAQTPIRVLCVADIPEVRDPRYFNARGSYLHVTLRYLGLPAIVGDGVEVTTVGWLEADTALRNLQGYDTVVLYDAPRRIEDSRGGDPYYETRVVVGEEAIASLRAYVESGGGLIVGGGVTGFGDGPKPLGVADNRKGAVRRYFGFDGSSLEAWLPVDVPEGETLTTLPGKRPAERFTLTRPHALVEGLAWDRCAAEAFHRVTLDPEAEAGAMPPADATGVSDSADARPADAEVVLAAADGSPLLVLATRGRGRVACMMFTARGNLLVRPQRLRDPRWEDDAVLWDRLIRWSAGRDFGDASHDARLRQSYAAATRALTPLPVSLLEEAFPYALHQGRHGFLLQQPDLALAYARDLGFTHVVFQRLMTRPRQRDYDLTALNDALRNHRLLGVLHIDATDAARHDDVDPAEYAQVTQPSGRFALHYGQPKPDPFSPVMTEHALEKFEAYLRQVAPHRQFVGVVAEDEWTWVTGYRGPGEEGGLSIGNYSPSANAYYRQATGTEVPMPVYRTPGHIMAENDPWLRWVQLIRQDGYRVYNTKMQEHKRRFAPWLRLSNYPGGFDGTLDFMVEEVYLDCWRESELEALERIDVRANARGDRTRRGQEIWALLGCFRMPEDKSIYPATLRLTAGVSLGAGAKGLILWNAVNLWAPYKQHPGRGALEDEAQRLGRWLERFGPLLSELEKVPANVWIASGWFWVNSWDSLLLVPSPDPGNQQGQSPWRMIQVSDLTGPPMMRAGMYVEHVTERQLLDDALFDQEAVLLGGMWYARQAVVDRLEEYIRRGGIVFVDESNRVEVRGAIELPVNLSAWYEHVAAGNRPIKRPTEETYVKARVEREAMVEHVAAVFRRHITPRVRRSVVIDDAKTAHTRLRHGDAEYVFIFNTDIDAPREVVVGFETPPRVVYPLPQVGDSLDAIVPGVLPADTTGRYPVPLHEGGWRVLALLPNAIEAVRLPQCSLDDATLRLRARVVDVQERAVDAVIPLRITLRDADGSEALTLYRATRHGVLDLTLPIETDLLRPETIEVKDLLSGAATEFKF